MKRQTGKTLVWSTAVLTLMLVGTACGGGKDTPGASSPAAQAAAPASPSASSSAAAPTESASASPSASASASATAEAKTADGEFQGVIDPHSIEIKVDGKTEAFQIDPETADKVSAWDSGTKVTLQYTENSQDVDGQKVTQLVITAIDKA